MELEMRQRELQSDLPFSAPALVPALHPPPPPISPGLHCCLLNKDLSSAAVGSSYVPVFKYKPLYECDFQFYQFLHLKSRSPVEDDYHDVGSELTREDEEVQKNCGEKGGRPELIPPPPQHRLKHHGSPPAGLDLVKTASEPREIMDSNGSSSVTGSISGSDQGTVGGPDVSAPSRTFDPRPLTAKGWSADTPADRAGAHSHSVKSSRGSSVRTAAVSPLPFSVEALLRA